MTESERDAGEGPVGGLVAAYARLSRDLDRGAISNEQFRAAWREAVSSRAGLRPGQDLVTTHRLLSAAVDRGDLTAEEFTLAWRTTLAKWSG
jgi:predicted RNA-binding protein associated with RNAse of E/G family